VWEAQEAQLAAETEKNNAQEAQLAAETEKNNAQERQNLIMIISASVVTLLLVVGGGSALYRSHRQNVALTEQLNKVAEQHEELTSQGMEIAYLRDWR
jgi:putative NADH-flavin reductase